MEHIANLAVALAQVQLVVVANDNARRILPSMLQYQQRIVDRLGYRLMTNYSDYSTHTFATRAVEP
jgi:hypothetical protein